jgi:hypothetical protein
MATVIVITFFFFESPKASLPEAFQLPSAQRLQNVYLEAEVKKYSRLLLSELAHLPYLF